MKKLILFVLVLVCSTSVLFAEAVVCNFSSDELISSDDAAILLAWRTEYNIFKLNPNKIVTIENVQNRASVILKRDVLVSRLPDLSYDVLSDHSGEIVSDDIAYLLAFITEQNIATLKKQAVDFSNVETRAQNIISLTYSLSKLPGTPIGDSSFTTTITGIQTD